MKKAFKYLGFVGLGALVVLGFVVSVNMVSTALTPEVQQYLETQKVLVSMDTFSKTPLYALVQETPAPEKMEEFGFLLSTFQAPSILAGPAEKDSVSKMHRWGQSYLVFLSSQHERLRLDGVQNLVKMYTSLVESHPDFSTMTLLLSGLHSTLKWIPQQEWIRFSERTLLGIKKQVSEIGTRRSELAIKSLDGELSYIFRELASPTERAFFNKFPRIFYDQNATMNEAFVRVRERKTALSCLNDYSCTQKCGDQTCWTHFYPQENLATKMKNPLGKKLLSHFDSSFHTELSKFEDLIQKIIGLSST